MFTALLLLLAATPGRLIRVSPVDHEGKPTECTAARCGLELSTDGRLVSSRHSGAVFFRPDLSVRARRDGPVVFSRERTGRLVGAGPYRAPEAVQVLFCELTDEPLLRCRHEFDAAQRSRVWNAESCAASFEARVVGAHIEVTFASSGEPRRVAQVEPPATDKAAKSLALFLYALRAIDADTEQHLPHIDDMQWPD